MSDGKKLFGRYRAEVTNNMHPEKHYKVQIRLLGLWDGLPDEALPWAEYEFPIGCRPNDGEAVPCLNGDLVWVEFEQGDTRCPIITGSCLYAPGGVPNLPHEAIAGEQAHQHKRTDKQPAPAAPEYGKDIARTHFGVLQEITSAGALRFTHKPTGTAFEFTDTGQVVIHSEAELFQSSTADTTQEVGGKLQVIVVGNAAIETDGDMSLKAGGAFSVEAGGALSFKGSNADWKLG